MKKAFAAIVAFATPLLVAAQHKIKFSYDAAGNRVVRKAVMPKAKSAQAEMRSKDINEQMAKSMQGISHSYSQGIIRVNIPVLTKNNSCELYVYSTTGAMVYHGYSTGGTVEISITHCPNGVYVVKAIVGEDSSAWKIVKH